ncbi:hypothetical protein EYF80_055680 [Liparis tanakae]|uniref:Uncharacterized protein n=1 Tax=Liparis tanakae TaxID=230148 RepID=A0A4Z2F101_9TELE|nr:hypothetical protein EYF80_055680 [Liparis tanakae]
MQIKEHEHHLGKGPGAEQHRGGGGGFLRNLFFSQAPFCAAKGQFEAPESDPPSAALRAARRGRGAAAAASSSSFSSSSSSAAAAAAPSPCGKSRFASTVKKPRFCGSACRRSACRRRADDELNPASQSSATHRHQQRGARGIPPARDSAMFVYVWGSCVRSLEESLLLPEVQFRGIAQAGDEPENTEDLLSGPEPVSM